MDVQSGIRKDIRDAILGHTHRDMDVHYIVVNDETLFEAIGQYEVWMNRQNKQQMIKRNDEAVNALAVLTNFHDCAQIVPVAKLFLF